MIYLAQFVLLAKTYMRTSGHMLSLYTAEKDIHIALR